MSLLDPRERSNDMEEALRLALDARALRIWTALPGIVESFDPARLTAEIQPAIQGAIEDADLNLQLVNLPLLVDCPVVFPAGGGAALTFPLAKGDEVLVVFSARCLDGWWQSGGVQAPLEGRVHHLSDGFVIPGPFSQPRRPEGVSATEVQLRSHDGATVIGLDPVAGSLSITAPGGVEIGADVVINGALRVTGPVTFESTLAVEGEVDLGGTGGQAVETVTGPATRVRAA